MSPELSKDIWQPIDLAANWQPTCTLDALKARATMYREIRDFFAARDVLEVETPLLCACAVTDPYIQAFASEGKYLQTSPEYAMKRVLAAGAGSIYQICKAFRLEEAGHMHNPEFTMLEWYRVGFNLDDLMQEMDQLLQVIMLAEPANIITYHKLFDDMLNINPHTADIEVLKACATNNGVNLSPTAQAGLTVTDWLQILMTHVIEPKLVGNKPWIVYDFPAAQAALAKVVQKEFPVAARFEVYAQGMELANGYYELQDSAEQAKRFAADNAVRIQSGIHTMQPDLRLVAALEVGLPDCSGVALGLDRVLMLRQKLKNISEVMAFTSNNA